MNISEIVEASLKLGLPVAVISWFMYSWLLSEGKLDGAADRKSVEAEVKNIHKARSSKKIDAAKQQKIDRPGLKQRVRSAYLKYTNDGPETTAPNKKDKLLNKWMWFGGGFYGMAALYTLVVMEAMELFNFIATFPGFDELFKNGVIPLLVTFGVTQITNLYSAFAWFIYWTQQSVGLWILVAYLGYMAGMQVAKFQHR